MTPQTTTPLVIAPGTSPYEYAAGTPDPVLLKLRQDSAILGYVKTGAIALVIIVALWWLLK
jgi:hypothetical protein